MYPRAPVVRLVIFTLTRLENEVVYKKTSLVGEYNYLYTNIPIISTFPSRRPSMGVFTDQLIARQDNIGESGKEDILGMNKEEELPREQIIS